MNLDDYNNSTAPSGCTMPSVYKVSGCVACPLLHNCSASTLGSATRTGGSITRDPPSRHADRSLPPVPPALPSRTLSRESLVRSLPEVPTLDWVAEEFRTPWYPERLYLSAPRYLPPAELQRTALLIDVSLSMAEGDIEPTRLGAAAEAGKAFVEERVKRSPKDEMAIVTFSTRARIAARWLQLGVAKETLHTVLDHLHVDGGTSIGAGLAKAETLLFGKASWFDGLFGRKADVPGLKPGYVSRIIVLSDGGHNTRPTPRAIARRMKSAGVRIDCVGIGARDSVDEKLLQAIASKKDGKPQYRFIEDREELVEHYFQLAGHITR